MKLRCVVAASVAALVLAPMALGAGGAAGQGYGGGGGNVQNEVGSGNAGKSASLPFTGLDLVLLVLGGATLLVVGASLRRAARRNA